MSSGCTGSQVVFVIHPKECDANSLKSDWLKYLHNSIGKLLVYLENLSAYNTKWDLSHSSQLLPSCKLKWGYKFANNSEIKFCSQHDFKHVNLKNIKLFLEEVKVNFSNNEETIDHSSHTLVDNLAAMVHDFQWEQLEIISPIKLCQRQKILDSSSNKSVKPQSSALSDNFVFVIGTIPRSQLDLNQYFDWQINSVDDIRQFLMPKHLDQLFRCKHNIRFFWLDTSNNIKDAIGLKDCVGYELMNKFLMSTGGHVVPITLLEEISSSPHSGFLNFPSLVKSSSVCLDSDHQKKKDSFLNDIVHMKFHYFPTSSILNYFCSKENFLTFAHSNKTEHKFSFSSKVSYCNVEMYDLSPSLQLQNLDESLNYVSDATKKNPSCIQFVPGNFHSECQELFLSTPFHFEALNDFKNKMKSWVVQLHAVGALPLACVDDQRLSGLSSLCKFKNDYSQEVIKLVMELENRALVLVVEKQFKLQNTEEAANSTIFNHYGILQPLSNTCFSITWFSDLQKARIVEMFSLCHNSKDDEQKEEAIVNASLSNYLQGNVSSSPKSDLPIASDWNFLNISTQFEPSMLESWYCLPATSIELKTTFANNRDSNHPLLPNFTEFQNGVMSELQRLYSNEELQANNKKKQNAQNIISLSSDIKDAELLTCDEVKAFISLKIQRCFKQDSSSVDFFKQETKSIVDVICLFVAKQEIADSKIALLTKLKGYVFKAPEAIRSKDVSSSVKYLECILQLFLRMEWIVFECDTTASCEYSQVDEISQFLRIVSLCESGTKMKELLNTLVEYYAEKIGSLLVEVHSDLMLPLPDNLLQFAMDQEAKDSFLNSYRAPSTGPFSMLSSVDSQDSTNSLSSSRFRFNKGPSIKPITSRQIEVPKNSSQNTRLRPRANDAVKRLFSEADDSSNERAKKSAKSHECRISSRTATKDVVKVRRDLFASPSKSRKRLKSSASRQISPEKRKKTRRARSVVDTPAAKQRLTALSRQRLRLRRSWESQEPENKITETVIEESPLKRVESQAYSISSALEPQLKRSPRHSIMLNRRHSFYRDGSGENCRTVARAKVVHQHKEAVPPTPQPSQCSCADQKGNFVSPKSLLFSYAGSRKTRSCMSDGVALGKTRRRLNLTSCDTSAVPFSLFNEKEASDSSISSGWADGDKSTGSEIVFVERTNRDITPFQSYVSGHVTSSASDENLIVDCASSRIKEAPLFAPESSVAVDNKTVSPRTPHCSHKVRRSPRLASHLSSLSTTPPNVKVGPLDNFVVRTPTPTKSNQARARQFSSLRKPSPDGDHIHKWPRRKRLSSLSPGDRSDRHKRQCSETSIDISPTALNLQRRRRFVSKLSEFLHPSCGEVSGDEAGKILETSCVTRPSVNAATDVLDEMEVFPLKQPVQVICRRSLRKRSLSQHSALTEDVITPKNL